MASLTAHLGDGDRAQLKAWFAAQKKRAAKLPPLAFPLSAADVFGAPAGTTGGALGVDFVTAQKDSTKVDLGSELPAIPGRPRLPTLKLAQRMGEGGIGAVVWNCGRALCHALPRLPELADGRFADASTSVLELGCGTGLVGLACWLRGAGQGGKRARRAQGSSLGRVPLVSADFWTSDQLSERSRSVDAISGARARGTLPLKRRCITLSHPGAGSVALTDLASIAPLARENALACVGADGALPPGLAVEALAWGDAPPPGVAARAPFDVVFGSDCLYDAKVLPQLLATLLATTGPNSVVYLAYKRRVDEREAPFFALLEAHFASVAFSEASEVPEEWRGTGLHICRLAGRREPAPSA